MTYDQLAGGFNHVDALSVFDLVQKRFDSHDPWRLALVQRHQVWDEVRMARLLDSLIAGYPIGSILLCRVRAGGKVLVPAGRTRKAVVAPEGAWQLLDGQQRINAFVALFTPEGGFGRFYVNMTTERIRDDIVTRRRGRRETTRYIVWCDDGEGIGGHGLDPRDRYLDLSRWHRWANEHGPELHELAAKIESNASSVIQVLNAIDPEFTETLDDVSLQIAGDRTVRLIRAWNLPTIPVQKLDLEDAVDVLQVFARINLEGVRLNGEDVFFAAVKTLWPDAEEKLDRMAGRSALISRMTSLRLLARLASFALKQGDLVPLGVDRLNGPRGERLVETMRRIARDDSVILPRIDCLERWLVNESGIGYGLRDINPLLLDHVFGWAVVNAALDDPSDSANLMRPAAEFLIGAHAFRYPTVFTNTFSRLAFAEALGAGEVGRAFPTERIVTAARHRWPELRFGRRVIAPDAADGDHRALVDANAALFLSIAQHLPFHPPYRDPDADGRSWRREVEWDHIWPQALANKMRVRHPDTGHLVHHHDRRLVWSAGNLWALDRPLNNRASDTPPSCKFDMIEDANLSPTRWPERKDAFMTDGEREAVLAAEAAIDEGDEGINRGMAMFATFVQDRSDRLYSDVISRYPHIARFASGVLVDTGGFEPAEPVKIDLTLGVDVPEPTEGELAHPPVDNPFATGTENTLVFKLADEAGLREEMLEIYTTARDLGLGTRVFARSLMITPPQNRTRMLFTVWPRSHGGVMDIYRWAPAFDEFFDGITAADTRESLGPDRWGVLRQEEVSTFLQRLRKLIAK